VNRVGLAARAALASALAPSLLACEAAPRPPNPRLTTLFDVQALYAGGATSDFAIATDAGLPGGIPIGKIENASGNLTVAPAWAESYPVGYMTTEVWTFYDAVWLQPMYIPVTAWMNGAPQFLTGADGFWQPIFSVGAQSGFYSPFWQQIYFDVPPGTAIEAIASVRQIVNGGYTLHEGPGLAAPLAPANTAVTDMTAGGFKFRSGWLDDQPALYIEFPATPFSWNAQDVIQEVPLYHFAYRKDDGTLAPLPIPTVVGTGPPYSNTPPPPLVNNMRSPKYSAYWRLYTVVIPHDAVIFAPPGDPLYDTVMGLGLTVLTAADYPIAQPDAVGRVGLNPGCFATDPDPHDGICLYLDSQAHIEQSIDGADIQRTAISVTCPIVSIDGMAVPN
jgi:hypothetical protein